MRDSRNDEPSIHLPRSLQRSYLLARRKLQARGGRTHARTEAYFTRSVFRWATEEWFRAVPRDADPNALRNAIATVLADSDTFHAYLSQPEAFGELYGEELTKLHEHRVDRATVKRTLRWRKRRVA
jgi:hypothetical protein